MMKQVPTESSGFPSLEGRSIVPSGPVGQNAPSPEINVLSDASPSQPCGTAQDPGIVQELTTRRDHSQGLPLPVQLFPISDDSTWEDEKQKAADLSKQIFCDCEKTLLGGIESSLGDVLSHIRDFLASAKKASAKDIPRKARAKHLKAAIRSFLPCSPKKIAAALQQQALAAGWDYVCRYNAVIDGMAGIFPRCRAGIYASRLKYADVLQIADEVLTTLRVCETLMDDLQRRYDMIEALQGQLMADLNTTESDKQLEALEGSVEENFGDDDLEWWEVPLVTLKTVVDVMTTLWGSSGQRTSGHMQRVNRVNVLMANAKMFQAGCDEWTKAAKDTITPNLKIMFELKRDFFRNQVLCLCDLATHNGYSLEGLASRIQLLCKQTGKR